MPLILLCCTQVGELSFKYVVFLFVFKTSFLVILSLNVHWTSALYKWPCCFRTEDLIYVYLQSDFELEDTSGILNSHLTLILQMSVRPREGRAFYSSPANMRCGTWTQSSLLLKSALCSHSGSKTHTALTFVTCVLLCDQISWFAGFEYLEVEYR